MNTHPYYLQFSARELLVRKLLYLLYPIVFYSVIFLSVPHKHLDLNEFLLFSLIIFITLLAFHYKIVYFLIILSIKNSLWTLSIKNNILEYYDPHKDKIFRVLLSQINYIHRNPFELKIIPFQNKEKIDIEIPSKSTLTKIQICLEDLGVQSIFKQHMEKKDFFNKKLKSKIQFYFYKSTVSLYIDYIASIMGLSFSLSIILFSSIFSHSEDMLMGALVMGLFFSFPLCREIEGIFTLLKKGAVWEIILINSQLIWTTPNSIAESFVLNLSDIEEIICLIDKDPKSNIDIYSYCIKLKSGEMIMLDDSSGVSLDELVPLLGTVRKIRS